MTKTTRAILAVAELFVYMKVLRRSCSRRQENRDGLKLQEWTLQEWTMKEEIAEPDITGVDIDGGMRKGGHYRSGQ